MTNRFTIVTARGHGCADGADGAAPADAAAKPANPARPTETTAPRDAGEPIMAIVSIKSQQVTIYDADGWIFRAPVSTGTKGRETPAGIFSVVEKDKDHHSNLYDDAWMPNMERITWSGIALHGGPLPGYAASHGCIRMPYDFAEKLFGKTQIGMRVIIAPNDAEPVAFSDPKLFVPKADALAAAPARAETLAREAADAAKAADEAKTAAAVAAREAAAAPAAVRKLEMLKARADAELVFAERMLAAAKTDQDKARTEDARQKVAAKATDLGTQLEAAKADAQAKRDAAAAAQTAAKAAEAKRTETAAAARDAKLALEPVSVFISRKTKKLYVRRGFASTIEVPIAIRDPDKPIGTHIFTAQARTDTGLRWTAVTIDDGDDAKDALDRISHSARRARPHRADRRAAILAHHLRRAAEPRAELSHRVRRRSEQPAPGRSRHPQARGRCRRARRLRLLRQRLCAPVRRPVWWHVLLSAVVKTRDACA